MSIAILVPSKGRAELCKRMIESAKRTKSGKVDVYLAISPADIPEYKDLDAGIFIVPDLLPTAHKWNYLAEQVTQHHGGADYYMLGADDMVFTTPLWDDALTATEPHVYHLQDSRDTDGTPHPIMTRAWVEKMGWFVPPIFLHWMIDSWTVEIAKANNCFTHLREFELQHIKPSDDGRADETHVGIRQRGWHERDMWVAEHCVDFLELLKGKLK